MEAFDGLKLDGFVAGVGTGGTITGAGSVLKRSTQILKLLLLSQKILQYFQEVNQVRIKSKGLVLDSYLLF